jgi:hypothetical protein
MDDDELQALDDPAFIAERRRLRDALNTAPDDEQGTLRREYARADAEFLRRASLAWQHAS